jgi:hypothetical protein
MYNTTFFAIKKINQKDKAEYFYGIGSFLFFTKCFGSAPYYQITLKETNLEEGQYFGWKDYSKQEYRMIWPSLVQAEVCFPYGSKAEEERGRGKLVGFILESAVEISKKE